MKNFQKLLPVAAVLISLSPIAANALTYSTGTHPSISHSRNSESGALAVNSKGRAEDHYAVNSKGRAGDHYAANSKGRPGEFARPATEQAAYVQYIFSSAPAPNANDAPIPNGN
jgi:hypothetical protein